MRIGTLQPLDTLLAGIQRQLGEQARLNEKMVSGKRFNLPSDNPSAFQQSVNFQHVMTVLKGGKSAIEIGKFRLQASMEALSQIQDLLNRAQVVATQQANAGVSNSERQIAASEVQRLLDEAMNLANATWQGEPLFAGTKIGSAPFVKNPAGVVTYQGNSQPRTIVVDNNITLVGSISGAELAFTQTFSALEKLAASLQANDVAGIRNSLGGLKQASLSIVDLNAQAGAYFQVLDAHQKSVENATMLLEKQVARHEQADLPSLVVQIEQSNTALQALYAQVKRTSQLSLVNYL